MRIVPSCRCFSTLVIAAALFGCSTQPTIVGTWKLRPTGPSGNVESIDVFDDGTIVRHEGTKGDFADRYDLVINHGKGDEFVVTTLTESVMVWSKPGGEEAFVFERVGP